MRDVMDSVKNGHYHVACTRVFEATHGLKKGDGLGSSGGAGAGAGESVTHPNKYVDVSREIERYVDWFERGRIWLIRV
jgi:DNA primase large subunit